MDNDLFLQHLRELSLEDGKAYIQEHIEELAEHAAVGVLIKDESQRQEHIAFSIALKLAELLIFFGEYVHHPPSHALGLIAKGNVLKDMGHHQAALECSEAAGEEFLRLGDEVGWARSRISWIVSASFLGRVEEALREAARAREVFLQYGEDTRAYVIDHNVAYIYARIGRYRDAINLNEKTFSIYSTRTDQSETFIKHAIALAELNKGQYLFWLGDFEQAHSLLLQAQAKFVALGETDYVINAEHILAELDYAQGYYGSALRRYYQARDTSMQNNLGTPLKLAWTMLRMASYLVKLNRAQEACRLAARAVETYRQLGVSVNTGDALREYSTTLVASGRLGEALATLDEAWILLSQGGADNYASATKLQRAELLLLMGRFTEAYNEARDIKAYFEAKGLVSRSTRASLVMADALIGYAQKAIQYQQSEQQPTIIQEATTLCKAVTARARQNNLQEEAYKSQYLLGRLAVIQEDTRKAVAHYRTAITQIERILDDLVYDLSPSFLHTRWAVYEEMISLCLSQGKIEQAFSYLERARSMALRQYLDTSRTALSKEKKQENDVSSSLANRAAMLQIEHELKECQQEYHRYSAQLASIDDEGSSVVDREAIQNELKRREAKLSELFERLHLYKSDTGISLLTKKRVTPRARIVDISQLRQHLLPGQTLLAYFLSGSKLVIFAITAERVITHENATGAAQLERLLPLLHAHLQPGGWSDPQQPPQQAIRRLLNKLYDLLIAPVAALLPPEPGHLTIVPYGPLHNLPFHALYDGSHFLIEDYQIHYLPASNMLLHLATRKDEKCSRSVQTGVTDRKPLVFGYSGNGHLQRVLDEAQSVAALLEGMHYLESEATIARLIDQAPGSPIIHIATHGDSRLDEPNFSYVRLADGQFNAIDAFSLSLQECELVTLSGCETGLALSGGGDEQLGLGRAFLAAGASSLVMSLWPVEDSATSALMQLFYKRLLAGDSKVQALREAQCRLLHGTSTAHTHPYFWAAFHLVGDIEPLSQKRHVRFPVAAGSEAPKK
jgi:CHAT domain-containing protein